MPTLASRCSKPMFLLLALCIVATSQQKAAAPKSEDLHIKKSITVGGNFVSSSESSIKGSRERTVSQGPNGSTLTIRQCDLKRTLTVNEQAQTYLVTNDPQDENAAKAAALAMGAAAPETQGGKITVTT